MEMKRKTILIFLPIYYFIIILVYYTSISTNSGAVVDGGEHEFSINDYWQQSKTNQNNFHQNELNRSLPYDVEDMQHWRPWPNDSKCSQFVTRFGQDLPLVFLVSYPRSGNTWLRYLIEGATGLFTGSVYNSRSLYKLGYLGEKDPFDSKRTIVVKNHALASQENKIRDNTPVILIIRNPLRSIVSYWAFNTNNDIFAENDLNSMKTDGFRRFVFKNINKWLSLNEKRLIWSQNLLILFYENLIKNPLKEVRKIMHFLQFPVDENRLSCLQRYIDGSAKRKPQKIISFTSEEMAHFVLPMKSIMTLAKLRGANDIPDEYSTSFNTKENSTLTFQSKK